MAVKVLTLRQPWAWAIFHAGKDIENRDFIKPLMRAQNTTLAIHTSQRTPFDEYEEAREHIRLIAGVNPPAYEDIERGRILGTVKTGLWVEDSSSRWFFGDYGLVILDRTLFAQPIPAKGALGLWEWTPPEGLKL